MSAFSDLFLKLKDTGVNPYLEFGVFLQDFMPIGHEGEYVWKLHVDGKLVSTGRTGEEALRRYVESLNLST